MLLRFANEEDPKLKEETLEAIKGYCHWNHNYTKPTNLKKIKKAADPKAAAEDSSEEEDEELRRYETRFNQASEFSKEVLVDDLVKNRYVNQIHQRYLPTIDYHKLDDPKSTYPNQYFLNLL